LEGGGRGLFEGIVLVIYLTELRKSIKSFGQDNPESSWDSIQKSHEYKSRALLQIPFENCSINGWGRLRIILLCLLIDSDTPIDDVLKDSYPCV